MQMVFSTKKVKGSKNPLHICTLTKKDGEVLLVNGVYAEAGGATPQAAAHALKEQYLKQLLRETQESLAAINLLATAYS